MSDYTELIAEARQRAFNGHDLSGDLLLTRLADALEAAEARTASMWATARSASDCLRLERDEARRIAEQYRDLWCQPKGLPRPSMKFYPLPWESPTPARQVRECVICGEVVTMSNATEEWEKRHASLTSAAHDRPWESPTEGGN